MLRDLTAPDISEPGVAIMQGMIDDAFHRLQRLVGDMHPKELEYQGPNGRLNSTATLVMHLAVTDLSWVGSIGGVPIPPEVRARYGPLEGVHGRLPEIQGYTAHQLLDLYGEVQARMRGMLRTLSDANLTRVIQLPGRPDTTVRWGLWHIAEHSMLHQGHIRWLKQWARAANT